MRRPEVVRLRQWHFKSSTCALPLPFPLSIPLKANVLQRHIHTAKSGPTHVGRALLRGGRRLLVALDRRAVVGRLVPLDSRSHDRNRSYELRSARGTRSSPFPTFMGPRRLNVLPTQIVYFGRAIPWIIIDAIPYFRKWKLQPVRFPLAALGEPSDETRRRDLLTVLNRIKYRHPRNSGSAPNSFYYRISRSNCLVYVFCTSSRLYVN